MEPIQQQEILSRLVRCVPQGCSSFAIFTTKACAETGVTNTELQALFAEHSDHKFGKITIDYDRDHGRLLFSQPAPVRRPLPAPASQIQQPTEAAPNADRLGFAPTKVAAYSPAEVGEAARRYQQQVEATAGKAKRPTTTEAVNHVLKERGLAVG